eukprot:scaffold418094_cov17-Prasinocladus_malaysianus.AAC.1
MANAFDHVHCSVTFCSPPPVFLVLPTYRSRVPPFSVALSPQSVVFVLRVQGFGCQHVLPQYEYGAGTFVATVQ